MLALVDIFCQPFCWIVAEDVNVLSVDFFLQECFWFMLGMRLCTFIKKKHSHDDNVKFNIHHVSIASNFSPSPEDPHCSH